MYDCPNCGGNLRFDIASQKLFCEYCESVMDPYEPERRSSGMQVESRDEYDVTVFTCPACGAEIASTNLSATGFCTYCGASAVFEKRVRGEKRPQRIIPFARTKEDCRNAYLNAIRHAAYVPKELKDPAFLDRFVGVYIPYWSYDVSFGPDLSFTGKKTYTKGNYEYTDYYDLNCQVAPVTQHMSFDASSSFDDHIGEVIGPFDEKGLLPFTPGFLAGFYSDIADVPSEIYYDDAEAAVAGEVYPQLEKQFPGYTVDMPRNRQKVEQDLKMQTSAAGAMFPVWFLTWRKDDRVAYSVVNGQTGKVYADIPVDLRQFLLFSLLLAVPLFVLLNFFLTITAPSMLALAAILPYRDMFDKAIAILLLVGGVFLFMVVHLLRQITIQSMIYMDRQYTNIFFKNLDVEEENTALVDMQTRLEEVNETINYQRIQLNDALSDLKKRSAETSALIDITQYFTSTFDLTESMDFMIQSLVKLKDANICCFLIEKDVCLNEELIFEAYTDKNYGRERLKKETGLKRRPFLLKGKPGRSGEKGQPACCQVLRNLFMKRWKTDSEQFSGKYR